MAKIVIDGKAFEVNPDNNLLQESLSQGLDLPYFCWHPCMGSVGACRQCAVKQFKDENDKKGMLVMACMTPASDGSIISINDHDAVKFRAQVIESLMISHPHDCPVCEEGGECHLQDMTLMSGHNYRRYNYKKVTHRNQYLGPFINHEMNRCITCYRCVRFYDDYAGGTDLSAQASHHHVYFGRHEEGVLESEFSGNLVEVCPTGVFTDKTFSEHYTRKWDLQTAPSVCISCSVGCNTSPGEREGTLRRIVNRYNHDINAYFLCDRGRFGYDFVNSPERLTTPLAHNGNNVSPLTAEDVSQALATLKQSRLIGIGSPRASNESNFALRELVGEENFYAGCCDAELEIAHLITSSLQDAGFHCPSVREIEQADAVLVIAEDLTNVAPRIALALRQTVRNKAKDMAKAANIPQWQDSAVRELAQHARNPLILLSTAGSRLDDVASEIITGSADQLANLGLLIAHKLHVESPVNDSSEEQLQQADKIAEQLLAAKRPLIIAGSSNRNANTVKAAINIARSLRKTNTGAREDSHSVQLCLLPMEVNTIGMSLLIAKENSLGSALKQMADGAIESVIVLENDLFRREKKSNVEQSLAAISTLLVLDQLTTATTNRADLLLPVTSFSEHEASYVNYEGRAQLSFQVHTNNSMAQPSWRWLTGDSYPNYNALIADCGKKVEAMAGIEELLPDSELFAEGFRVPRQPHRYSGRTALQANLHVNELQPPHDRDSVMSFSMEGVLAQKDARLLASPWAPRWNSNQSISKFQDEINGELTQQYPSVNLLHRRKVDRAGLQNLEFHSRDQNQPSDESGYFHLIPALQIFGSDELSSRASAIKTRTSESYAAISLEDAQKLNIHQGQWLQLEDDDFSIALRCCIREKVRTGNIMVFVNGNPCNQSDLPARVRVTKSDQDYPGPDISNLIVSDLMPEESD